MMLPSRRLVSALCLCLIACGPSSGETAGDSTAGTGTTGPEGMTAPTSGDSSPVPPSADEQLCLDYCLNLRERSEDCAANTVGCYEGCMGGLADGDMSECPAVYRASLACEATATEFDATWNCDAPACEAEYAAAGLCTGYCTHLGSAPFSGSVGEVCSWGSRCFGHKYTMECPQGPSPTCSCTIDDIPVGACDLGAEVAPLCPDRDVFAGCCNEFFVGTLAPAQIDDPGPSDPGPAGTAVPGEPCALVGFFLACTLDDAPGLAFCDDLADGLQFGPCVVQPACELSSLPTCEMHCELVDGVPTWVESECSDSTSG